MNTKTRDHWRGLECCNLLDLCSSGVHTAYVDLHAVTSKPFCTVHSSEWLKKRKIIRWKRYYKLSSGGTKHSALLAKPENMFVQGSSQTQWSHRAMYLQGMHIKTYEDFAWLFPYKDTLSSQMRLYNDIMCILVCWQQGRRTILKRIVMNWVHFQLKIYMIK